MARLFLSLHSQRLLSALLIPTILLSGFSGCSRRFWRQQVERDSYGVVREKLNDSRWQVPRIDLRPDSRSRFYDPYDPDCEPLPPDDPAAHQLMHCVNGKKGYKSWHKLGRALSIENPHWLEPYGIFMENADPVHGHPHLSIPRLTLQDAVELSYIHSRDYQTAIEDLYLAALPVTQQRFNLGVRYNGPNVSGVPGFGLGFREQPGSNTTGSMGANFGVTQLLPSGAQLAMELANDTIWLLGSGDTSSSASSLSFALVQPLLFRAGRKIVLEALTQAERSVLYEARSLARFRQTLFTGVIADYLSILQQEQNILIQEANIRQLKERIELRRAEDSRPSQNFAEPLETFPEGVVIPEELAPFLTHDGTTLKWRGEMTEEQQDQLLALSDDPLYQAAAQEIVRWNETSVTSLSVAQLLTQLNSAENGLLDSRRALADRSDLFKISLGLPTDVQLTIDYTLLKPFELIDNDLITVEESFKNLAREQGRSVIREGDNRGGAFQQAPAIGALDMFVVDLARIRTELGTLLAEIENDFGPIESLLTSTEEDPLKVITGQRYFRSETERNRVINDVARDLRLFRINERDFQRVSALIDMLVQLTSGDDVLSRIDKNGNMLIEITELPPAWRGVPRGTNESIEDPLTYEQFLITTASASMGLREDLLKIAQSLQVVQAGLRVEVIALNPFTLPGEDEFPPVEKVVEIGLENRHDLMNARGIVMDARRRVEIAANALEANLDVNFRGSIGTGAGKPLDFQADESDFSAGLTFDTPMDKIVERNAYSDSLIDYQRARRDYMLLEDRVKQQIRQSWRQLQVSEERLETDRQTVRNAALQLDNASLEAAGVGTGQNNSLNLLNALDSVLGAQRALIGDWITYETNRLNIFRDMGIMDVDPRGVWRDDFYQNNGIQNPDAVSPATAAPLVPPSTPLEEAPTNEQ